MLCNVYADAAFIVDVCSCYSMYVHCTTPCVSLGCNGIYVWPLHTVQSVHMRLYSPETRHVRTITTARTVTGLVFMQRALFFLDSVYEMSWVRIQHFSRLQDGQSIVPVEKREKKPDKKRESKTHHCSVLYPFAVDSRVVIMIQ